MKFVKGHHGGKRRKTKKARHNPAPSKTRRRRVARRNPSGLDLKEYGVEVGTIGAGLLGGVYINNMAARWLPVRFRGLGAVGVSVLGVMFGGNSRLVRNAALAVGGMGVLDLVRANVPALVPLSAEDAGYLLGAASAHDSSLAAMLGVENSSVPGVLDFGAENAEVPGVLDFGTDTGTVPMGSEMAYFGTDTGTVPMGEDDEGDDIF
jgi:hypothetical protein